MVRHYVGITTLWHGTNLAGLATIDQIAAPSGSRIMEQRVATFCASCPEFLTGSAFMQAPRGRDHRPGVSYTSIVTRNDELVCPTRAASSRRPA